MNTSHRTSPFGARVSRRSVVGGGVGAAAGLAGLVTVGCGDDDDGDASPSATPASASPGASPAASPTVAHKRGGVIKTASLVPAGALSLDPDKSVSVLTKSLANYVYSRLVRNTNDDWKAPNVTEPDLASKYEVPDPTTYTFSLRDAKWQNLAPMNGRAVTAEDFVYSYERFMKLNANRAPFEVAVDKLTALDSKTLQFKLKAPSAPFLYYLGSYLHLYALPKELVERDGDLQKAMVGTGPWKLKNYVPSSVIELERNPDYYEQPKPYADGLQVLLLADSAAVTAALIAGQIHTLSPVMTGDLDSVKASIKGANVQSFVPSTLWNMAFDTKKPPFNDVRVRRAVSMVLDRNAMIKAARDGVGYKHNMPIPTGLYEWWLDPESKDMGQSSKYYAHNVKEAKSLMEAAGYSDSNRVAVPFHFTTYTRGYPIETQLEMEWLPQIYIDPKPDKQESAQWISTTYVGKFDGAASHGVTVYEPDDYASIYFDPSNPRFLGANDPDILALVQKQRGALVREDRKAILWELQRQASDKMWYVPTSAETQNTVTRPELQGRVWGSEWTWNVSLA